MPDSHDAVVRAVRNRRLADICVHDSHGRLIVLIEQPTAALVPAVVDAIGRIAGVVAVTPVERDAS
jgi:nitrate reductase NapAB chaperone NapD